MKPSEISLLTYMSAFERKLVPIYQRPYSWTEKHCRRLWDDLLRIAKNEDESHFVGSIVDIQQGIFTSAEVPEIVLIDGQQRITTLVLILLALGKVADERGLTGSISSERLGGRYLFTDIAHGDEHYKLLLTDHDKATLKCLLDHRDLPHPHAERLVANYQFFELAIRQYPDDLDDLKAALGRLVVVQVRLDRERDNPQLIFESLNSTGLDLTQADLIRNYLLMDLEPAAQEDLYRNQWFPMEQEFGTDGLAADFDKFMRDYLTVRTGGIPKVDAVYERFKEFARSSGAPKDVRDLVADIVRFSRHFSEISLRRTPRGRLGEALRRYNDLKVFGARPFLMRVWDDFGKGLITDEQRIEIVEMVESFVFRRAVCGIRSNRLDILFADLIGEIDLENYVPSIGAALLAGTKSARFPADSEFELWFKTRDAYNFRPRLYLLSCLENHGRKEPVDVYDYTTEHVMPQSDPLPVVWQQALGQEWDRIHRTYLHTIGNLTLTGYNSEMSDRGFVEKRDIEGGFAQSPLRLNRDLARLSHWGETEIEARAIKLLETALQIWRYPEVPSEMIAAKRESMVPRDEQERLSPADLDTLTGPLLGLYEALERRVFALGTDVDRTVWQTRVTFKAYKVFLNVAPRKSKLLVYPNLPFDDIDDPRGLCRDVSKKGHHGVGDVEIAFTDVADLDYVMQLIEEAYDAASVEEA